MGDTIYLLAKALSLYALYQITRFLLRRYVMKGALDDIPGPPSKWYHFAGVLPQVCDIGAREYHQELIEEYGSVIRIRGLLGSDQLYVSDPKALHHITIKVQHMYEEARHFVETTRLIFGEGILSSVGAQHRRQRKMLNPIFSSAHMRGMIPIFYDITHKLIDTFSQMTKDGSRERIRTFLRYPTEYGTKHAFSNMPKEIIPLTFSFLFIREYIIPRIVKVGTPKFRRWMVDTLPLKGLHEIRDLVDIMHNTAVEVYESKKRAFEIGDEAVSAQIAKGKDLISILMRANMDASSEDRLTENELLGQLTSLIFAAMDTTSGALSRVLYLLAENPDIQDKLRAEILTARQGLEGADLGYDQLNDLPYLDAVCRETLRLYPPVSLVQRVNTHDVVVPFSKPITNVHGTPIDHIHIPKDTTLIIPIIASNLDPQLWGSDSYEWKPERWLQPLPEAVQNAQIPGIYSYLMTFLGGRRGCIGFKFSQLEMKVVLSSLLTSFRFAASEKSVYWHMTTISSPSLLPNDASKPQLPLVIGRLN